MSLHLIEILIKRKRKDTKGRREEAQSKDEEGIFAEDKITLAQD